MIMYHEWRCDGYKGALQVKFDGGCEFCAYDIIGTPAGGETRFANLLTDDWDEINAKFKEAWRAGSGLCVRCVYWHNCKATIAGGFKKVDDQAWQQPFLDPGEPYAV
jgi:hypothetical protein